MKEEIKKAIQETLSEESKEKVLAKAEAIFEANFLGPVGDPKPLELAARV